MPAPKRWRGPKGNSILATEAMRRLAQLPDEVVVYPTHGAGSFCVAGDVDIGGLANTVDIVGTGGDASGTFNISTAAALVGSLLIYNTMTFSVVQRRPLFGTLRSLGVTSGEVFRMVIAEAFIIGVLGAGFGILLGILMGRGAVGLVSQTINDLFFVTTVQDVAIPVNSLVKGGLMGVLLGLGGFAGLGVLVGLSVYLLLSRAGPLGVLDLLYTPTAMIIAQTVLVAPIITAVTRQLLENMNSEYAELFASFRLSRWARIKALFAPSR